MSWGWFPSATFAADETQVLALTLLPPSLSFVMLDAKLSIFLTCNVVDFVNRIIKNPCRSEMVDDIIHLFYKAATRHLVNDIPGARLLGIGGM